MHLSTEVSFSHIAHLWVGGGGVFGLNGDLVSGV